MCPLGLDAAATSLIPRSRVHKLHQNQNRGGSEATSVPFVRLGFVFLCQEDWHLSLGHKGAAQWTETIRCGPLFRLKKKNQWAHLTGDEHLGNARHWFRSSRRRLWVVIFSSPLSSILISTTCYFVKAIQCALIRGCLSLLFLLTGSIKKKNVSSESTMKIWEQTLEGLNILVQTKKKEKRKWVCFRSIVFVHVFQTSWLVYSRVMTLHPCRDSVVVVPYTYFKSQGVRVHIALLTIHPFLDKVHFGVSFPQNEQK